VSRHITRLALSVTAVAAGTLPAFFVPACLSSPSTSDGGPPSSSSSSSGGSSGGSSGNGSGSGTNSSSSGGPIDGGPLCLAPDAGPVDSTCIIDDMTGNAVVSGGPWYTYSDRVFPNSSPPQIVDGSASAGGTVIATSAGMVTPPEGAQFPPVTGDTPPGGPTVPGVAGPAAYREFSASGLTLWGAGMGFNWTNVLPDSGAPDPDASSEAGPAAGQPGPYDASAHKGIAFYGISNGSGSVVVSVHFSDAREAPAAGECDASVYVNNPVECGDDYFKNYTFTNTWQNFTVKFADPLLKTQNYSGMALAPGKLDTTQLYQVHFQVTNTAFKGTGPTDATAGYSISVAYVTWYDGN
jgi:hypothetical protein